MSWLRIDVGLWALLGVVWLVGAPLSRRTLRREPFLSRLAYLLPLVVAFVLVFSREAPQLVLWLETRLVPDAPAAGAAGVALTAAGVGFAIWARLHLGRLWSGTITLKEGHRLVRSGPYAYARHPIYTGFLLAMLGTAVVVGTVRAFAGVPLAFAAFAWKSSIEERLLAAQFGDEHRAYRAEVRRLVPFVW